MTEAEAAALAGIPTDHRMALTGGSLSGLDDHQRQYFDELDANGNLVARWLGIQVGEGKVTNSIRKL
ncbi:MAG: hypothetical protein ABWY00_16510 [Dongiaceae bacterium]